MGTREPRGTGPDPRWDDRAGAAGVGGMAAAGFLGGGASGFARPPAREGARVAEPGVVEGRDARTVGGGRDGCEGLDDPGAGRAGRADRAGRAGRAGRRPAHAAPPTQRQLFPRPQTTRAGLDRVFVYIIVALRLVDLAQMIPAVLGTVGRSPAPVVDLAVGAAFLTWSLVLISLGLTDGSLRRRPWLVHVDIFFSCLCLVAVIVVTPPALRDNLWDAWGSWVGYSSALFAGMALRRPCSRVAAGLTLFACAVAPTTYLPGHPEVVFAGWTNALIYPAYTAIGYVVSDYLRRVADAADEARRVAAQAAASSAAHAEAARHRTLLHDQATILELVSRRIEDPVLADALRRQAGVEARKVAAFLTQPPLTTPTGRDTDLAVLVRRVAQDFTDLRVDVSVDLADGAVLRAPIAAVVVGALTTILHNVRRHALAEHTVVHADVDEHGWELVVRDDGVGFDPQSVRTGYGLGEIVTGACRRAGLDVTVDAAPGEGTAITLRGGPQTLTPDSLVPDPPMEDLTRDRSRPGEPPGNAPDSQDGR